MDTTRNIYIQFLARMVSDNCDVDRLVLLLYKSNVITDAEKAAIKNGQTNSDKLEALFIDIMPTKDQVYQQRLTDVLEDLGKRKNDSLLSKSSLQDSSFEFDCRDSIEEGITMETTKADAAVKIAKFAEEGSGSTKRNLAVQPMSPSDFENTKFLGMGYFGKVYKAIFKPHQDNRQLAIKKLHATGSWRREVGVIKLANHPNVVTIFGVVENLGAEEIWLVTEYMGDGSLRPYCTGEKRGILNCAQKLQIGTDCWSALTYLHDTIKIMHEDIKPENILLRKLDNSRLIAKLCDFGLAKIVNTTFKTNVGGTPMYLPPETNRNLAKADVYSMGATLCELYTNLSFWHHVVDTTPLETYQICFALSKINNLQTTTSAAALVNEDLFITAAAVLDDRCPSLPLSIRNALKSAVAFDDHKRPAASSLLTIFFQNTEQASE